MTAQTSRTNTLFGLGAVAAGLLFAAALAVFAVNQFGGRGTRPELPYRPDDGVSTLAPATRSDSAPGFLYARVTTKDHATYEGRLRWGAGEEAFWGDYFNGTKSGNPWAELVPRDPAAKPPFSILGFEFGKHDTPSFDRPFMARFGDIARIESTGPFIVRVTMRSGVVYDTQYMEANDFADGVRVWADGATSPVDLDALQIVTIDFLPTAWRGPAPDRLHGTVRSRHGEFTGFLQWDRESCVGSDTLDGRSGDEDVHLRFDAIRSIARRTGESSLVTLADGREMALTGTRAVGRDNRGVYVDDPRYGRVLVTWDGFDRVDFTPGDSGPAYGDFPPGRPLTGRVTTRDGRAVIGRVVYDLDEAETTDTLDASSDGVSYTLPFGLIASIELPSRDAARDASVTLHSGEVLRLERSGDLSNSNGGLVVFVGDAAGGERAEYVSWANVQAITLDRPVAMFPPVASTSVRR